MTAEIIRVEVGKVGTFGNLLLDGKAFCVTLELPWRKNRREVSSIPVGTYRCVRRKSPLVTRISGGKYSETFEITSIPGRSDVLFHAGNNIEDTKGCVLVAASFRGLKYKRGVSNSGATFDLFMQAMKGVNEFQLTVREVDLTPQFPEA